MNFHPPHIQHSCVCLCACVCAQQLFSFSTISSKHVCDEYFFKSFSVCFASSLDEEMEDLN